MSFEILHHGAEHGVTGSCHEMVYADGKSILVDCGLFQGAEVSKNGAHANGLEIDFDISRVQALFITHAHIDHVGRIPYLLAAGFDGPIYCSVPTAKLMPVVLEDALKIGFTRNERLIKQFLGKIKELLIPVEYKEWSNLATTKNTKNTKRVFKEQSSTNNIRFKMKPAGHILGSAYIEFSIPKPKELLATDFTDDHRFEESVMPLPRQSRGALELLPENGTVEVNSGSALEDLSKSGASSDRTNNHVSAVARRAKEEQQTTNHRLLNTENRSRGKDYRIVFSGDLGAPYSPLLPAPKSPYRCDTLVLESTYGDKCHGNRKNRSKQLKQVIERALEDKGAVLIPAFSIGRTQELLYEIESIIETQRRNDAKKGVQNTEHRKQNTNDLQPNTEHRTPNTNDLQPNTAWDKLEVIIDSPMAAEFTGLYNDLKEYWDAEAKQKVKRGRHPLSFDNLWTVESHQEHLSTVDYIRRRGTPCIVIAASGMCSGGRIMNYLKALIEDKRTDVLFVGYQAQGTPGRVIQKYGPRKQEGGRSPYVDMDGKRYDINAGIHTISGYSAHADQKNLVNFVKRMRHKPHDIRLVHGDKDAKDALRKKLTRVVH